MKSWTDWPSSLGLTHVKANRLEIQQGLTPSLREMSQGYQAFYAKVWAVENKLDLIKRLLWGWRQ